MIIVCMDYGCFVIRRQLVAEESADRFYSEFLHTVRLYRTVFQKRMSQSTVRKPGSLGVTSEGVDFLELTEPRSLRFPGYGL